jgi:hypothetical protein
MSEGTYSGPLNQGFPSPQILSFRPGSTSSRDGICGTPLDYPRNFLPYESL